MCVVQTIVLSLVLRVIANPWSYSQRTSCPTKFPLTQALEQKALLLALVENPPSRCPKGECPFECFTNLWNSNAVFLVRTARNDKPSRL